MENNDFNLPDKYASTSDQELQDNISSSEKKVISAAGIRINTAAITKPVILLIGPQAVGKTVTLIRLARYLENGADYEVVPNRNFRSDIDYGDTMDGFNRLLNDTRFPPDPTVLINFLLVDIKYQGETIFHILEAPGENYFKPSEPNREWFYPYFMEIIHKNIQKIFVFMFTDGLLDNDAMQKSYSKRLGKIVGLYNSQTKDKLIFCLNKVDEMGGLIDGKINQNVAKNTILDNPNYVSLKNKILSNNSMDPASFVAFSSGQFSPIGEDEIAWTLSGDQYPRSLWNAIEKKPPFKLFGFRFG